MTQPPRALALYSIATPTQKALGTVALDEAEVKELERIAGAPDLGEIHAPHTADSSVDFLKEWLVRHTLLEDLG